MTVELIKGIVRGEIKAAVPKRNLQLVNTTNATPVLLFSIETVAYERGKIVYTIEALKDDGISGASIKRIFSYKNDGSSLTINAEQDILNDNDFTTADVAASANVDSIEVKATGEASTNIYWIGSYEQEKINVEVLAP